MGVCAAFGNLAMEKYLQCEKMLRVDKVEKSRLQRSLCNLIPIFLKTSYYMYIYIHIYVYAYVFIWKGIL